jgi:hypothetical protein
MNTAMETPAYTTLLNLVQTVNAYAASEDEVVATVVYLINSGKVVLCGNFAGAKIDCSALGHVTPHSPIPPLSKPATFEREPPIQGTEADPRSAPFIAQACDIEDEQGG